MRFLNNLLSKWKKPSVEETRQHEESMLSRYIRFYDAVSAVIPSVLMKPQDIQEIKNKSERNRTISDEIIRVYPLLRIYCKPMHVTLFRTNQLNPKQVGLFLLKDNVVEMETHIRHYYDDLLSRTMYGQPREHRQKWFHKLNPFVRHHADVCDYYPSSPDLISLTQYCINEEIIKLTKNELKALRMTPKHAFNKAIHS